MATVEEDYVTFVTSVQICVFLWVVNAYDATKALLVFYSTFSVVVAKRESLLILKRLR